MRATWTNWTGRHRCAPARRVQPRTEEELVEGVVRAAADGLTIRPIGSGHSFGPLCVTDGCHVDVSRMNRVLEIDPRTGIARVQAGITIHALAEELHRHGRALENQGDIDHQTIAGALSTGTHGTGARFGNLATGMVGGRLVTAAGEVIDLAAEDPDVLRAARVSLGALGVLSEVHLRTVPAFRIHKVEGPAPLGETLARLDELVAEHDHFELFAIPWSERCLTLCSRRTDEPPDDSGALQRWISDELLANATLRLFQEIGRAAPAASPLLGKVTGRLLSRSVRRDHSHRVYANERRVRFNESEWALPRAALPEAITGVLKLIERERLPVSFPIEVRVSAGDDAPLSPAYGRDTGYVAVHQYVGSRYMPYFRAVQDLMRSLDGRPHWGKRHGLQARELAPLYPEWDRFQAVRARLDPEGVFTNPHLAEVLGPVQA